MKKLSFRDIPIPASVYRIQLNADFSLKKAIQILPYLKKLGVEGVYCSPYFKAFSDHGYDVTDPNSLNPLLGTPEEYELFCETLKQLGLLHLMDIVPNHMGIKGGQNSWWQDVLENGPYSEYATFFDINWSPDKRELQDKVLLPILGVPYGKALENQEIKLSYADGEFLLRYADYPLPVTPHTYAMILENELDFLKVQIQDDTPEFSEYQKLIELYRFFPVAPKERILKKQEGKEKLAQLYHNFRIFKQHITHQVQLFNGKKRKAASFDLLDKLLEAQFYRLSYWRVASHEINYRRFFTINELVSLRIESDIVLENHHRWIFELINKNQVQGLRIDHPDGLYDPVRYFEKLREKCLVYTVVEKILERKERLPETWQIEGTVGYEYLNLVNGVFIQQDSEKAFTDIYEDFTGQKIDYEEILYASKKFFTNIEMASEVEALGLKLDRLSEKDREYRDFTRDELTRALAEVIVCFPVYRSYIRPEGPVSRRDKHYIKIAIEKAKNKARDLDALLFDFLEKVLLVKLKVRPEEEAGYREFVLRFQQLTAPMMAKGLEDTAFYVYNRFIALNEVGGDPLHFGYSVTDFHMHNLEKREKWPYGVLATSTHDAKRSEDIRMRLNVLSEMPEKWKLEVKKWAFLNSKHKQEEISSNTEYFIYQTLLGVWPQTPFKEGDYPLFCERIWKVILKSMREAKQETSWHQVDANYEEAVKTFFFTILSETASGHFLEHFKEFHKTIDRYGAWNSLSQSVLKIGSPGVVDIYQGNEMLNYRLVDPDNRMPVDLEVRSKMLQELNQTHAAQLFANHELSKVKLLVQTLALRYRLQNKDLFFEGSYTPLKVRGLRKNNVIAFLRKLDAKVVVVITGRFFSHLAAAESDLPLKKDAWADTEVILPSAWEYTEIVDLFTHKQIQVKKRGNNFYLRLAQVFEYLPVSYLIA